jgi:hypothetical protein
MAYRSSNASRPTSAQPPLDTRPTAAQPCPTLGGETPPYTPLPLGAPVGRWAPRVTQRGNRDLYEDCPLVWSVHLNFLCGS